MKRVQSEFWMPADNMELEPSALNIAKNTENNLVVAGPGAGKTELLAQKACYLLQTNTCKFPYKILAISFKRDAALNLKERISQRCGDKLSKRFDSLTFDSFAKQILDRFMQALPNEYKIKRGYDVILNENEIRDYYRAEDLNYFSTNSSERILAFHSAQLPHSNKTSEEQIRHAVWSKMIREPQVKLSFKMIMRLAECIINSNPKIKQYLQQTYQYVFLDEFQDTTVIQYEFFKSCFLGSNSFFTAVGDDKQRIMLWAGAKDTIFEEFIRDTGAVRIPLLMNFRCAPRLVALLNYLAKHLLDKTDVAISSSQWAPDHGTCYIWMFKSYETEIKTLFQEVSRWIRDEGINQRDICILVKQQLLTYAGSLISYFNENGIKARDEGKFQDIISQEVAGFIINALYLIFDEKNNLAKNNTFNFLINLHAEFEDYQLLKQEEMLLQFIKKIRQDKSLVSLDDNKIKLLIAEIVAFADKGHIIAHFPQYKNLQELDTQVDALQNELISNYQVSKNMISALDMLVGKDTIPVMTIHKSKGLEYHTVIFIGLEDRAFWSFQTQSDEDKCAFFVALSRAKERAVFTFSEIRPDKYGKSRNQSINEIGVLYDVLANSGIVDIIEIDE